MADNEPITSEEATVLCRRLLGLQERTTRDTDWAHRVCKAARRAHIQVWSKHPKKQAVRELLALLEQLRDAIAAIANCTIYEGNVKLRIESITSYLDDGLPASLPNPPADEAKAIRAAIEERLVETRNRPRRCPDALKKAEKMADAG